MTYKKKDVYKPKPITEGKRDIIRGLLTECDIQTGRRQDFCAKQMIASFIHLAFKLPLISFMLFEKHCIKVFHIKIALATTDGYVAQSCAHEHECRFMHFSIKAAF